MNHGSHLPPSLKQDPRPTGPSTRSVRAVPETAVSLIDGPRPQEVLPLKYEPPGLPPMDPHSVFGITQN